ncbi:MAG TPA: hypothetical protein VIL23_03285 [Clostridia bacterium]
MIVVLFIFILGGCHKPSAQTRFPAYGAPVFYPYPSVIWQTTAGGSKDDYVKDVFCRGGYIYILGESNSYDINFTSAKSGQKLFLGRLDLSGEIKNIWTFAAADKQNSYIKSILIDDYLYVLGECGLDTKTVVLYKVDINNGQAFYKTLGSKIFDEDALDLIHYKNKLYVIGQNLEHYYNNRGIFIEQLDLNLNQQNFQRFLRSADLKYIGSVITQDAVNIWINAVAINNSYPVMIDISGKEYVYHNFENPFYSYRLLDAKPQGEKTLLIFAKENQNNAAAYCFFENGKFGSIMHIQKDNVISGKILPCQDYAAAYLDSDSPSFYIISDKYISQLKNLNHDFEGLYKNFGQMTAAIGKRNDKQYLIIIKNSGAKVLNLEISERISAFWIEKDYLIAVSNKKNKDTSDIIITLIKAMPYQFA